MGMSTDLYVYRDEDKHAVAVARPHTGPNGGFSAHHIAKMALPSKRLTQDEIDGFADLFAAAPDMLAALRKAEQFIRNGIELGYIRMPDAGTPDSAHNTPPMIRAAIAKAEGGAS